MSKENEDSRDKLKDTSKKEEESIMQQGKLAEPRQLRESLEKAKQKVNEIGIPGIAEQIIPYLEDASKQVSELEKIYEAIDEIKNQIIKPVKSIITKNSMFGIAIGSLGIVFTLITLFDLWPIPHAKGLAGDSNKFISTKHMEQTKWAENVGELITMLRGGTPKLARTDVARLSNDIERRLEKKKSLSAETVDSLKQELALLLEDEMKKGSNADYDLVAWTVYTAILGSSALENWEEVLQFIAFVKDMPIEDTIFTATITVFEAEAYDRTGLKDRAQELYNVISKLPSSITQKSILSPDLRKRETIMAIVDRKTSQIYLHQAIPQVKVLLINASVSGIDGLAANARRILIQNGFTAKNITTGDDDIKADKVYAYYRKDENKPVLQKIITILYPRKDSTKIEMTMASNTKNPMVKTKFQNESIDILIRMPDK